jgi:hypothetical protein
VADLIISITAIGLKNTTRDSNSDIGVTNGWGMLHLLL